MTHQTLSAAESMRRYELRFQSLFHAGRGVTFPCDRAGEVRLDGLSERARAAFLHAQANVGREFASPAVQLSDGR